MFDVVELLSRHVFDVRSSLIAVIQVGCINLDASIAMLRLFYQNE